MGFRPFGDGGAFPEIHVFQYPLGMGKNKMMMKNRSNKRKTLPVTVDAQGNVAFDAVVRQSENSRKIVYSQHYDVIPKILKNEGYDLAEDEQLLLEKQKILDTTEETKAALEKIVNARLSTAQPKNIVPKQPSGASTYIKYKERIVRMVEKPVDPFDPPKNKQKRLPKPSGSPPVPVMHSPPRPLTVKDQQDCNIPPCIPSRKNTKGHSIPLDKRLVADGRGLENPQINDNFAKFAEVLYVAEEKAREAISVRSKVSKEMEMKDKERKEQELRALAQKARRERTEAASILSQSSVDEPGGGYCNDDRERERTQRDHTREERRRERERERRLEAAGKKSKITRDRERDISEKVALGMTSIAGCRGGEVMYDQRLFNQEKSMDSGFAADDQYNLYDKGLFNAQPTLSTLYKPKKDMIMDDEMYHEQLHNPKKSTERFKPDKAFTGAGNRERPLEFDKEDPFGLAQWACNVKKAKKLVGSGSEELW